jgi:hypothetical protein
MKENEASHFWHENLGRFLTDLPEGVSTGAVINHRTLKGIKPLRIGAVDAFYIATPTASFVLGRVEQQDGERVKFLGTEQFSARKYLAEWLIHQASAPFMVGVLGKANALPSLRVSHHVSQSYFCEAGGGFGFNLNVVRDAQEKIASLPWKKTVAPAIHQYSRLCQADPKTIEKDREKMQGILAKSPELRQILPLLKILPSSGEYTVLSWLNIEKPGAASET